jgi:hypothetical protein
MGNLDAALDVARFLLTWHAEHGLSMLGERSEEMQLKYRDTLARFRHSDLANEADIRELAQAQRMGIFEIFYAAGPPESLWARVVQSHHPELACPSNMGDVAALILALLGPAEGEPSDKYEWPTTWQEALGVAARSVRLKLPDGAQPLDVLRHHFASLGTFHDVGLGGEEFLITMNVDVSRDATPASGDIEVFGFQSFGFELVDAAKTIVGDVLERRVSIEGVTLGVEPSGQDEA